uniref:Serine/threonine-protein phosphatase 7 long form homolog n=1 Tax=Nicotiana sylvestris TaxID=4096 RepID=A0A1U7YSZ2_NICSY|nr:PREDICTED: serine/threonine-protein phosphatase 7 long form homolog [Nicotiana sylvestris]
MTHAQYLDLLGQYTGFRTQGEAAARGGTRISVIAIRQHMEVLHPDITGEADDLHIQRYTRLAMFLLFGGVLFPNTSGNLVSLLFLHHLQQLDELPQYSWGATVLAYLYRSTCRASMGTQVWAWERFLPLQPPIPPLEPDVSPPFLPLARRWVLRRGNYQGSDAHHNLPLVRDVLDMLEAAQFIWTPYNDELIADLPDYCSVDRQLWSTSVPLMCLDVVEHHAIERVLRQFDRPQTIPREPALVATHYQRDDHSRVEDAFIQAANIELYTSWYRRHTRLMIGNPVHQAGGRFRPYAGRHEALAIWHHMVYQLGQEMQQHADNPAVIEYDRRVVELALRTLQRAKEDS